MITPHRVHAILKKKMGLISGRHYRHWSSPGHLSLSATFDDGDQIIIDTLKRNGIEATFDGMVSIHLKQTQKGK